MPQGHFCQNGGTDIASVGSDEGQHGTTIASRDMPSFEHGPPFYVEGSPPGTLRSVFTGRARALSLPEEMFQRVGRGGLRTGCGTGGTCGGFLRDELADSSRVVAQGLPIARASGVGSSGTNADLSPYARVSYSPSAVGAAGGRTANPSASTLS